MNTIREAILKAADWIASHPHEFNFRSRMPDGCGSPGCAIGWVGHFMGMQHTTEGFMETAGILEGKSTGYGEIFYPRMNTIIGYKWIEDASVCANGLRAYANEYFPASHPERKSGAEVCKEIMSRAHESTDARV